MTDIKKLYDRLTTQERVKLTVEAFARRDSTELDVLIDTAPVGTYRIADPHYFRELNSLHRLAHIMDHEISRKTMAIAAVCIIALMLESDDEDTDELHKNASVLAGQIKGLRIAWGRFCETLGYDPGVVCKAFRIEAEEVVMRILLCAFLDVEPDPEYVQDRYNEFLTGWQDVSGLRE